MINYISKGTDQKESLIRKKKDEGSEFKKGGRSRGKEKREEADLK